MSSPTLLLKLGHRISRITLPYLQNPQPREQSPASNFKAPNGLHLNTSSNKHFQQKVLLHNHIKKQPPKLEHSPERLSWLPLIQIPIQNTSLCSATKMPRPPIDGSCKLNYYQEHPLTTGDPSGLAPSPALEIVARTGCHQNLQHSSQQRCTTRIVGSNSGPRHCCSLDPVSV